MIRKYFGSPKSRGMQYEWRLEPKSLYTSWVDNEWMSKVFHVGHINYHAYEMK